jgi:hypothetical protein
MKKFSVNKIKKYIADRQKLKSDKAPWTERWALTKKLWKQQMIRGGQRWYSDKVKYLQSMIDKKREQIKKESKNALRVAHTTKFISRYTTQLTWVTTTWSSVKMQNKQKIVTK